ncbi:MAG: hypothetical protein ABSF13_12285 [Smithella sp.]|jgi:hypothetical protein
MSITKFEAQMELSPVQSTEGYPRSEATREYAVPMIIEVKYPVSDMHGRKRMIGMGKRKLLIK